MNIIILAALALVFAFLYVRMALRYRRNIRKVAFMFDAIDNNDFTFRFVESGKNDSETMLNRSLNRIRRVIGKARDEAVEREKYYEQIMDAAGTALLVVDGNGCILQHNSAALRLFQRSALTHICQIGAALEHGGLSTRETYTTLRGERVRIIAVSDINSELANSEIDSWIKLTRVLTHEIMNTITPIASLSATMLPASVGEQREGLEAINRTSSELLDFVDNYRRFTHVPQPQPKAFYVKPFLERMAVLAARGVSIDVRPADLLMYADEALMGRVVTNILKNACEAVDAVVGSAGHDSGGSSQEKESADEPKIWISAYTNASDAVVIDICNNASLIPDDVAAHIFVPFFTTKSGGSGIGLPLSRQIVRMSGGMLRLVQDKKSGTVKFRIED